MVHPEPLPILARIDRDLVDCDAANLPPLDQSADPIHEQTVISTGDGKIRRVDTWIPIGTTDDGFRDPGLWPTDDQVSPAALDSAAAEPVPPRPGWLARARARLFGGDP